MAEEEKTPVIRAARSLLPLAVFAVEAVTEVGDQLSTFLFGVPLVKRPQPPVPVLVPVPTRPVARPVELRFVDIREVGTEYEVVDVEERVLRHDARGSSSSRNFTETKVWTRTWQKEKGWDAGLEVGVGFDWAGFNAKLKGEISRKYTLTGSSTLGGHRRVPR